MCISRDLKNRHPATCQLPAHPLSSVQFIVPSGLQDTSNSSKHHAHAHHIVIHNYHDHVNDSLEPGPAPLVRGGVTTAFPLRLHELLDQIEVDGFAHVVSWQPHGRCFVVHDHKEFAEKVMPTYFKQSKFASFQRQLNLYGFNRLTKGIDKGGYYHELFLRGKTNLAHKIQRMKVKGTGVRARSNPVAEPNFYDMPPVVSMESNLPEETFSTQQPFPMEVLSLPVEHPAQCDEDVTLFEGLPFHLIEPDTHEDSESAELSPLDEDDEVDSGYGFFDELKISRSMYWDVHDHVDDDDDFGSLLERVLA